jgi:hypothetical protein
LPADKHLKIAGINNRWLLAALNSVLCVCVELWLNHIGALTWEWPAWNLGAPWLIWLVGYLPFFVVAYWIHDMASNRQRIQAVGALAMGVTAALAVFAGWLQWI